MELLNAIQSSNNSPNNLVEVEKIIEKILLIQSVDLDKFTKFYLSTSKFSGVTPTKILNGRYIADSEEAKIDIKELEFQSKDMGTEKPADRSNLLLSAARIIYDTDSKNKYFYAYLCRSLTSKADSGINTINEKRHIDTIKSYYLQALKVYESFTDEKKIGGFDEQDAVNALYRYLFAHISVNAIPIIGEKVDNQLKLIKERCEEVFEKASDDVKIFNAIKVALMRSPQYASKRLLGVIFDNPKIKNSAINYLQIDIQKNSNIDFEMFAKSWIDLSLISLKQEEDLHEQIHLLDNFHFSETWLNANIGVINSQISNTIFNLDTEYLNKLKTLLGLCIQLINTIDFDEKLIKFQEIKSNTFNFLNSIETDPTKLSIEEIHPIVSVISRKLEHELEDYHTRTKPELDISSVFPSYISSKQINLQIKISNKAEGHAEKVELIFNENDNYIVFNIDNVNYGTIRGKNSIIKIVEIYLTPKINFVTYVFNIVFKMTRKSRILFYF